MFYFIYIPSRDNQVCTKYTLLTLGEESEEVAVVVRKLVDQQLGPVLTEKVKGHKDLRFRLQATSCECQMDEVYQTTTISEWWLTAGEPFHQVKLDETQRGKYNFYEVHN